MGNYFSPRKKITEKFSKTSGFEAFDMNKFRFTLENINIMKEKQENQIKTFYNRSNKKIKNEKLEKNSLMIIREEFRTQFNQNKDTEAKIFMLFNTDKDGSNIEQIIILYRQIVLSDQKSASIIKIHNLISKKKEEIYLKQLDNPFVKITKENSLKIMNDIKSSKWNISSGCIKKLKKILEGD